ncbi:MAG: 4Fe-4S binding protein [Candidatus Jordarchaeum sp.]
MFFTHPKSREPYKITNDWIVTGIFSDQCIGCMQCVNICPKSAITIEETG